MRRIAIINQKGGVGKTTSTVNIGMGLARAGNRVLLIDLDPQAHLSLHLGIDPAAGRPGAYEMLTSNASVSKAREKVTSNLWVVGSSIDLAAAEVELVSVVGREVILRDLLEQHMNAGSAPYDYVLFDCPPSLGVLTLNALCAAQEVFIPLQPHYLALQGLGKLLETVTLVGKRINPGLIVGGVIVCLQDAGTKLGAEVLDDVRSFFSNDRNKPVAWSGARVFQSVIRRNIKLAESPSYGKSIFDYAPDSNGAKDYENLVREIMGLPLDQEKPVATPVSTSPPKALAAPPIDIKPEIAPVAPPAPAQAKASTPTPAPVAAKVSPPKPAVTKPTKSAPAATPAPVLQPTVAAKATVTKATTPQVAPAKADPKPVAPAATKAEPTPAQPAVAPIPRVRPSPVAAPAKQAPVTPSPAIAQPPAPKPVAKPAAVKPTQAVPAPLSTNVSSAPVIAEKPTTPRPARVKKSLAAPSPATLSSPSMEKVAEVPVVTSAHDVPVGPATSGNSPAVTFSVVFAEPQPVTPAPPRPARSKKTA